jgi:hypothetical protein
MVDFSLSRETCKPVPEIIDPVFAKTSQNARFLLSENERFGLVFVKTGSINSGTGLQLDFTAHGLMESLLEFRPRIWTRTRRRTKRLLCTLYVVCTVRYSTTVYKLSIVNTHA